MKGISGRVVRLVALLSVAGVVMLGNSAAFAADPISNFAGSSNATALKVLASPDAVLNVNLSQLKSILASLPLVGTTVDGLVGPTLANVNAPISVLLDQAEARGTSELGQSLSKDTQSTTTPVAINADSLNTELTLLKAALKNVPATAIAQVTALLQGLNLPANNANLLVVENALNQLSSQLADTLGNPAANVFDTATAVMGGTGPNPVNNGNVTAGSGFLTSGPFILGPFSAEALAADSKATNTLTSVSLGQTGQVGVPSITSLLSSLATNLQTLENALNALVTNTTKTVGLGSLGSAVVNLLGPVTSQINQTLITAINTLNNAYNTLVSTLAPVFNALGLIDGLKLNDLLGTGPSTALSSLSRALGGGTVTSDALSNLAHVDALKLTNPVLVGLLKQLNTASGGQIPNLAGTSLVSVDGIKGTATVTADGINKTVQNANGQLLDITVLGMSLKALTGNLDDILAPGHACIIQVPGGITCPGLAGGAAEAALATLSGVIGTISPALNGLITITLTRGANTLNTNGPDAGHGIAGVVSLEINVALDCSKIPALGTVNQLLGQLPLAQLSLCGGSTQAAQGTHAATASGTSSLLDVQLGVANAQLGLAGEVLGTTTSSSSGLPQPNPSTGTNELILAALALTLLGAGIGVQRWRRPFSD